MTRIFLKHMIEPVSFFSCQDDLIIVFKLNTRILVIRYFFWNHWSDPYRHPHTSLLIFLLLKFLCLNIHLLTRFYMITNYIQIKSLITFSSLPMISYQSIFKFIHQPLQHEANDAFKSNINFIHFSYFFQIHGIDNFRICQKNSSILFRLKIECDNLINPY